MPSITIYSTPSCIYCKMAKAFFAENKVAYTDKDVATDVDARNEMVKKSGQLGVPVIDVGGHIVVGFDKETLTHLIGIKK